jgi:hypothetical protein
MSMTMENSISISVKDELEDIINNGLREDIYIAQREYFLCREIDSSLVFMVQSSEHIQKFFHYVRNLALNETIMALNRLYDNPDKKFPNRSLLKVISALKKSNPPHIAETFQTIEQMQFHCMPPRLILSVEANDHENFAPLFASYLENEIEHHFKSDIATIKPIRNKILAHNENTLEEFNFKWESFDRLLGFAEKVIGILGWAYFSTAYMIDGKYELTEDAKRMSGNYLALLKDLKIIEKIN